MQKPSIRVGQALYISVILRTNRYIKLSVILQLLLRLCLTMLTKYRTLDRCYLWSLCLMARMCALPLRPLATMLYNVIHYTWQLHQRLCNIRLTIYYHLHYYLTITSVPANFAHQIYFIKKPLYFLSKDDLDTLSKTPLSCMLMFSRIGISNILDVSTFQLIVEKKRKLKVFSLKPGKKLLKLR